jgi:hypothetical protein
MTGNPKRIHNIICLKFLIRQRVPVKSRLVAKCPVVGEPT